MNYVDTFIKVAPDCPAERATRPLSRGNSPTIAAIEFGLLSEFPYRFTQEELQFELYLRRSEMTREIKKSERAKLWKEFFSEPRACLRASALPKKYGWGLHFDCNGRVALVPRESDEYREFSSRKSGLKVLVAMRNRRV